MLTTKLTKQDEITIVTSLRVMRIMIADGRQAGTRRQKAQWIREIDEALAKIDVTK